MNRIRCFLDRGYRNCFTFFEQKPCNDPKTPCSKFCLCNRSCTKGSAVSLKQEAFETVSFTYIDRLAGTESSYCNSRDAAAAFITIQVPCGLKSFGSLFFAYKLILTWAAVFQGFEVAPICYHDVSWTHHCGALDYALEQYLRW